MSILFLYTKALFITTVMDTKTMKSISYAELSARYPGKIEIIKRGVFKIQMPIVKVRELARDKTAIWTHGSMTFITPNVIMEEEEWQPAP